MAPTNALGAVLLSFLNIFGSSKAADGVSISLTVNKDGGNASSPLLYGIMFEDINNSGDGVLHGNQLSNNGFQGDNPNANSYRGVGGANVSMDSDTPLSDAITKSLKVTIPTFIKGQVGFANVGYKGVPVTRDTFFSAFWMKGHYEGNVTVGLAGADGTIFGSSDITVKSNERDFTYYETTFIAREKNATTNVWQLTFDAATATNGSLWFDLVQLFPSTYHQRKNGLRADVANFIEDLNPSFLRFPGGDNLQGIGDPSTRWIWNNTIGPLENRPGRQGTWGYSNTDALGLMEYMYWCQDMNLEPVLAVFSGHTLTPPNQVNGESVIGDDLLPYVQEAMDELEFLKGNSSTKMGALRAQHGQQEPFNISIVEIGNEDNLNGGCPTYATRFMSYYTAINDKYPDIRIIASTNDHDCLPQPLPKGVWTDVHHYLNPDDFVKAFNEFDNAPRNNDNGILVGEFSCDAFNGGKKIFWSTLQGSIAEAVYMIGLERNSDIVKAASYAPLLEHYDMAKWSPDLIGADARPGSLTGSASYYVQRMFSRHRGARILDVKADGNLNPLFWVASATNDTSSPTYHVKVANYGGDPVPLNIKIPGVGGNKPATTEWVTSGNMYDSNHPFNALVTSQNGTVNGDTEGGYQLTVPAWAAMVITISN